jgi:hypothetical protein
MPPIWSRNYSCQLFLSDLLAQLLIIENYWTKYPYRRCTGVTEAGHSARLRVQ